MPLPGVKPSPGPRVLVVAALVALAAMFLCGAAATAFVDPDLWHEMALIREALTLGQLPLEDQFAYTPTVTPVIHHEWGTGVVLYTIVRYGGAAGLLALKYALTLAIAVSCFLCARRRARLAVLCPLAPLAIYMSWTGLTTVRAQMFTLLMVAILLNFLDRDRDGARWWIGPWLVLFVIWENLHGGAAIAFVFLVLHIAEQGLRRRPVRESAAVLVIMGVLVAANPYGSAYYSYLWRALSMDRPLITEWWSIASASRPILIAYCISFALLAYAVYRLGVERMPGLALVAFLAYAAARHQRHVSVYAVAWLCYVPGYIQQTRLGEWLTSWWTRRPRIALASWALAAAAFVAATATVQPWRLRMPANEGDNPALVYPIGAVAYLEHVGFQGNLMVPFHVGAYVSWKLHPEVKVSIDGRYEVAYEPTLVDEHLQFYNAEPGWRELLSKYPTDAVLVPTSSDVHAKIPRVAGWIRAYRDDSYELYVRGGISLPRADLTGRRLPGRFP